MHHVRAHGEDAKISARNARRDANATLKLLQDEKEITEDDLNRSLKEVQTLTGTATAKIDAIVGKKEEELMEV